jgi:hypothetical protein
VISGYKVPIPDPAAAWPFDAGKGPRLVEPEWVIDRTIARLAFPDHIIGLILTKHPERMAAYFNALPSNHTTALSRVVVGFQRRAAAGV